MHFPILSSLVALPIAGALLLLLVRDEPEHEPLVRNIALIVSVLVFAETLLLWSRFDPAIGRLPVRRAARLDSRVRHQLFRRRRRHQPVAARAHRFPDAARAARLVGIGAPKDPRVLHVRAAARERDDGRVRLARPVPVLRVLGRDADSDVLPDRHLGLRPPHLRRDQVHALHDGRQRADAAGDSRPRLPAQHRARAATASTC